MRRFLPMVALMSLLVDGCAVAGRSSAPREDQALPPTPVAATAIAAPEPVALATASPVSEAETAARASAGSMSRAPRPTAAAKPADDGAFALRGAAAPKGATAIAATPPAAPGPVRAGEWDDNANYREFQRYLSTAASQHAHWVDVSNRQFLVVRDADGKAVPRCPVTVRDEEGRTVTLTTTASGRAILFPRAEGLRAQSATASASCEDGRATARVALDRADGVIDLKLDSRRASPHRRVDLAFVLDTTGSMGEEITAVKATIQKVASALQERDVTLRIGLVEYKDRSDPFVTRVYDMTSDVARFRAQVSQLSAGGGGDYPESVNEGLHVGLTRLEWSGDATLKLAFLIGDAPPHLDYAQDADYAEEMKSAAHRGIQVFTVAASGMDALGQVVWRQIAQYTGATNLFVLRGGAGPQSTGGGDPVSSCGGTQTAYASGNLDELIVRKVERELRAIDGDPLRIPGAGMDENAKPCNERLVMSQ